MRTPRMAIIGGSVCLQLPCFDSYLLVRGLEPILGLLRSPSSFFNTTTPTCLHPPHPELCAPRRRALAHTDGQGALLSSAAGVQREHAWESDIVTARSAFLHIQQQPVSLSHNTTKGLIVQGVVQPDECAAQRVPSHKQMASRQI